MKKGICIFALMIFMFGAAGGQENKQAPLVNKKPLNEIKVDMGPLFVPLFLKDFMEPIYAEASGFGMKAGYERMLLNSISVGAEFSFITASVEAESFEAKISSIDAGIHGRFYPWKKFFYVQGGFGIVLFNFDIEGTTGALEDFKENFDPYTGVTGVFDLGFGWRWLIGGHFIIDASIISGLYIGNALSATTLFKLASGGIPALTESGFPLRFDAAIALGWAF
ncbi:MAG: autotransporter outer membrane beta-barrel domain-containing protein [Treponema sp.]|jgi:hypothetical protein|nr:autotransporter outer membrane beta-barrel domain-containing protein [Treponema sp.]